VPLAIPLLRVRQAVLGRGFVRSYVKARMLTHDVVEAERYRRDPLIFRQIAVNVLLDLHDTSTRLLADAAAIHVPALILAAGADWVVNLGAERTFFERLSSPVKEMHVYEGFYHAIFHERDRDDPIAKARDFIRARLDAPAARPSLAEADASGYTKNECDRLQAPGGRRYAPVKWALQTAGRLSDGVRLGWRTGFDSGLTLDYVYENRSRGITPLGRLIDRAYLNSIGWRGIRQRRVHVEQTLRAAVRSLHTNGRTAHLLDVASGPGRYVLETIRSVSPTPVTALLRDARQENVEAGRMMAARLGLAGVNFAVGDAFDRGQLATIRPRPTIVVVSGLYELFPQNRQVLTSLRGLADLVEPGGYLIYTNQPWHPQVEFIARVLTNWNGERWVMRRRTQAEMDELVAIAGFRKLSMAIDRWGIFSVSLAQRIAA
jgi:SAM-dependent methyltransferase